MADRGGSPSLLTVDEAARELRLSYQATLGLIRRGDLPAAKIGKPYRIRRDAIDECVRRLEHAPPDRLAGQMVAMA